MARLFTSGAEENNVVNAGPVWTATSGTISAETSPVYSGTYSYRTQRTSGGTSILRWNLASSVTSGTYYIRARIRRAGTPSSTINIIEVRDSTGATNGWYLELNTSNVLTLYSQDASSITGPTMALDTWYRIEIEAVISDTVGTLDFRVNGSSQGTLANEDTLPTNIQQFRFGCLSTVTAADLYWDDIAINDATGSFSNSWPGDFKTAMVVPASDASVTWEDETAGAATYANINSLPAAVDDVNYNVEAVNLSSVDRFGISTIPAEVPSSATMSLLHVMARIGSNQTSTASGNIRVWDEGGSSTDGDTFNCNLNGWKTATSSDAAARYGYPANVSAKTKANVQSYNIGYINTTDVATRERRISEMWVNLEWIESGETPPVAAFGDYAGQFRIIRPTLW